MPNFDEQKKRTLCEAFATSFGSIVCLDEDFDAANAPKFVIHTDKVSYILTLGRKMVEETPTSALINKLQNSRVYDKLRANPDRRCQFDDCQSDEGRFRPID